MARAYRALTKRGPSSSSGTVLHLIGDGAEASLCGIPRASLTAHGILDELVCADCIEFVRRRNTGSMRKVSREEQPSP